MRPTPRADLKVGFACNNRCLFCAQGDKRATCPTLPVQVLLARLARVRERPRGLVLTGGEPTMHKELVQLVSAARALGFDPIQIQTNGRMLSYPHVVERLIAAGAREFSPSLHGATAAVHDALTRAPGSHAQSVLGIRNAVAAGALVVTNSVVTRQNLAELPALVALLAGLGVRQAQLACVHLVGSAAVEDVSPRLPAVASALCTAREVARARGLRLVTEAIPLCFLVGMEDLAVEDRIPATTVLDLDGGVGDHSAWRRNEGKLHGPPCTRCRRRETCEGPWREYPERFGWGEFVPFEADSAPR